jgi:hypothetical protein
LKALAKELSGNLSSHVILFLIDSVLGVSEGIVLRVIFVFNHIKYLVCQPDDKQFLPVYTDGFEFAKVNKGKEWNAGVFRFADIIRFIGDRDGVVFNPDGHRVIMTGQQMMAIEVAAQQAEALKNKKS